MQIILGSVAAITIVSTLLYILHKNKSATTSPIATATDMPAISGNTAELEKFKLQYKVISNDLKKFKTESKNAKDDEEKSMYDEQALSAQTTLNTLRKTINMFEPRWNPNEYSGGRRRRNKTKKKTKRKTRKTRRKC